MCHHTAVATVLVLLFLLSCPFTGGRIGVTSCRAASQCILGPISSMVGAKLIWFCPRTPPRMGLMCAAPVIISHCLQLNYTRPGLPKLNPKLLESWKNEVKEKGHINCPNNVSIFSLLWASLALLGSRGKLGGKNPPRPGSPLLMLSPWHWAQAALCASGSGAVCVELRAPALAEGCTICAKPFSAQNLLFPEQIWGWF